MQQAIVTVMTHQFFPNIPIFSPESIMTAFIFFRQFWETLSPEFRFFFLLIDKVHKGVSLPTLKKTQDLQIGMFCFYDQL